MIRRHALLGILFLLSPEANAMNLNDTFNLLTTPVSASFAQEQSQGTAFFYHRLAPPEDPTKKEPQWRAVENTWLITNRHMVLPRVGEGEVAPDTFVFHLRKNHREASRMGSGHPNPGAIASESQISC